MLGSEDPPRLAEAMRSFDVVAGSANAPLDLVLQAEYKIGRCLEKRGQSNDAIEQYYAKVVLRFLQSRERGVPVTESAKTWFTRAAFTLADIFETRKEWRQAVSILERVTAAGIPVPEETRERIRKIRADYWWLFR
jgi:hypothetical protein